MASLRKRGRVWYFRFVDADGVQRELKGCSDRRVTEEMARAIESETSKLRSGILDPREKAIQEHDKRPLVSHMDDWHESLLNKGATPKHAKLSRDRAKKLVRLAKADRLSDLVPSRVQSALGMPRSEGLSLQTCNHHRTAIRSFVNWALKDGRVREDRLVGLTGFNVKEDRRHDRRTLSLDELRRLIATAESRPTYRKMSGPARALCYRLAVATGLRYAEIMSITPKSFDFRPDHSSVTVQAGYTKNGDTAILPLPEGDRTRLESVGRFVREG